MEKLIRKILNFDANSATAEDRDDMCVTIAAISMFLLDKSGKFQMPNNLAIVHRADIKHGSYGCGEVNVNNKIFSTPEWFLEDITSVAHETCHRAQDYRVDGKENINSEKSIVYRMNYFNFLLYSTIILEEPGLAPYIEMFGFEKTIESSKKLKDLKLFFRSFYDLQSFELEAVDFSISVVEYIIKTAYGMNLSDIEKSNLNIIEQNFETIEDYKQLINHLISLRQDKQYIKNIENIMSKLRLTTFYREPEFFDVFFGKPHIELLDESKIYKILYLFNLSLDVGYDDKIAHDMFDFLVNVKQNINSEFLLVTLVLRTKIKLSEKEMTTFKEIFDKSENFDISIESILKEKSRALAEREAIANGDFEKSVFEF